MKRYLILLIITSLSFNACKNAFEKEAGQIDSLMAIVKDTENALLSVDTSRVFSTTRQMQKDIADINSVADTLDKETAFKLADYYSSKKQLYQLTSNYATYNTKINLAKKQLNDLKQDLNNGLITKEKFSDYYRTEQMAVVELNNEINRAINGLEVRLQKMELNRAEIADIIEKRKLKAEQNNNE